MESNSQFQQLLRTINYVKHNSPYYKNLFLKNKITVDDIKSLHDLAKLPLTTKDNLYQNNWDFCCVLKDQIIEINSTSGTLGDPVIIAQTKRDLRRLAYNEFQSFRSIGATHHDIIHLMLSLDRQFMAGIAYHAGATALGAGIIRMGPGNVNMQLQAIQRYKPTILIAVPSFVISLIAHCFEKGIDPNKLSVKKILCIGENIRNENWELNPLSKRIIDNWKVELYSTYASTEMQTAFTECQYGKGGHSMEDLIIFEVLDENGKTVLPGAYGELTITTLGIEGMPLIRYQTGDICTFDNTPCLCGRTSPRISPIKGRKNQLIKYKGTTLYPPTIFNALNGIDLVQDFVIEVTKNDMGLDDVILHLAVYGDAHACDPIIKNSIQSRLRIIPEIKYPNLETVIKMQTVEGKRKIMKFLDKR